MFYSENPGLFLKIILFLTETKAQWEMVTDYCRFLNAHGLINHDHYQTFWDCIAHHMKIKRTLCYNGKG